MSPTRRWWGWCVALTLLLIPASAPAQEVPVGDPLEEYLRVLQVWGADVSGSFTVRPFLRLQSARALDPAVDPWKLGVRLGPRRPLGDRAWVGGVVAEACLLLNSSFPEGQNDGSVWSGRGLTGIVAAGGTVGLGPVEIAVRPVAFLAQNSAFDLAPAGSDGFGYPWSTGIDAPQRFGPGAYSRIEPGESSAGIVVRGVRLGAGSESLWWGPGLRNAIVLSNNAGGFPHVGLGTNGPVHVGIGVLEAQWVWGRLAHSDWWDETRAAQDRFFTGAVVSYSPRVLPGLTVGASRVFYRLMPEAGLGAGEYLLVLQGVEKKALATGENPTGDDVHDQLGSVFARWVFAGSEVYGEWARNDHAWDYRDLVTQLGHSAAYTLGLRRVIGLEGGRLLALTGEASHLERSSTSQIRAVPTYYVHHRVPQGYTHRGQILGAGIGPGGNVQFLGADLYHRGGRVGTFVQRRVHDNDAFYAQATEESIGGNHVSMDVGASALIFKGALEVGLGFMLTKDHNRYFVRFDDLWNANLEVHGRWRMK
ncbi:MAG TPA: capsule assembly Wzi family protein [Longimicrobiales bacterium]|nr:capsule assembly Wzi family protein [Longimicrobiales bacterium]